MKAMSKVSSQKRRRASKAEEKHQTR